MSKTYDNGVTETINYNIQGWQTATAVTNGNSNIYSQQLKYYNPTKGSTPLYTSNKLMQITGTENNADISNALYVYDQNGNMIFDGLKNLQISYSFLNLPSVVTQDDTPVAEYGWFADGSKYRVLSLQNNGYIYIGSLIYASNNGNLNYLDYGARMYDSNIGRWTTQDPLAEKYYSQSPYNYCVNNPVMFVGSGWGRCKGIYSIQGFRPYICYNRQRKKYNAIFLWTIWSNISYKWYDFRYFIS